MRFEFDPNKGAINERERGLPFDVVETQFDFDSAVLIQDTRRDYQEIRILAYGLIGERVHVLCFKPIREGRDIRIISLRKANKREVKKYVQETTTFD